MKAEKWIDKDGNCIMPLSYLDKEGITIIPCEYDKDLHDILTGQVKKEKEDSVLSLELCLGVKIKAMWLDEMKDGSNVLNIRCIDEKKKVEGTMVFELATFKDLKAL